MGISIDIADLKNGSTQVKAQKDIVDPNRITLTSEEVERLMTLQKLSESENSSENGNSNEENLSAKAKEK